MEIQTSNATMNRLVTVDKPKLFFPPTSFNKTSKISSMSTPDKTIPYLRSQLSGNEINWFLNHPQFKHIFHKPLEKFHKCQAMWSLVLRTVRMKKQNELWFVYNGFPIRYSIREHALITGLDCTKVPDNYEEELEGKLGDDRFSKKFFKKGDKVSLKAVFEKLQSMEEVEGSDDRLKMAVLYFLGSVINPKKKTTAKLDSFLVNIVNDLELCKSFPWGSFTFIRCLDNIRQWIKVFKSKPSSSWTIPGFTIAFEILAFECIQPLKSKFRENVNGDNGCPRMCRSKFKHTGETGYSLDAIYKEIVDTKEILSVLVPDPEEQHLLANIFIDEEDTDLVADSWNELLMQQNKVPFWNDLYEEDLSNREVESTKRTNNPRGKGPNVPKKKRKQSSKELRDLRLEVADLKKRVLALEASGSNGARATDDDMNQEEHREHEEDALHMTQAVTPNDPSEHEKEDVEFEESHSQEENREHEEDVGFEESQPQSSPFQPQSYKCNLINHNGNKDVVAIGICYPKHVSNHGVRVKPDEVVVTVSVVKVDIRLWAPVDDVEMLSNAIGQFIVWPKEMVLNYEEELTGAEEEEERVQTGSGGTVSEQQIRELTGPDEEEEQVQTGSGGTVSEQQMDRRELTGAVQTGSAGTVSKTEFKHVYVRRGKGISKFGRLLMSPNRYTPNAYK